MPLANERGQSASSTDSVAPRNIFAGNRIRAIVGLRRRTARRAVSIRRFFLLLFPLFSLAAHRTPSSSPAATLARRVGSETDCEIYGVEETGGLNRRFVVFLLLLNSGKTLYTKIYNKIFVQREFL